MIDGFAIVLTLLQGCVLKPEAKLVPSLSANGFFGVSVDVDQDRIVVGAPTEPAYAGGHQGAAYVFERSGSTWIETAILADWKGPPPPNLAEFGRTVSLDGIQIAVGAPGSTDPNLKVFVYRLSGGVWNEEATLQPPATYRFGHALDLVADSLVVGAPFGTNTPFPPKPGSVLVYVRGPTGWSQQAVLNLGDTVGEQGFGWSVKLSGETLFIGSPDAHGAAANSGAVYVYTRSGTVWTLQQRLIAGDGGTNHDFGWSVAAEADTLLVGAPTALAATSKYSGAVYVFSRIGNKWIEKQKLISPSHWPGSCGTWGNCLTNGNGRSVAIAGDYLSTGESGTTFGHLFSLNGGKWVDELQFTAFGVTELALNFGYSQAISNSTLAVGQPVSYSGQFPGPGAIYVFQIQGKNVQPRFYCTPKQVAHCLPRIFDIGQPSVSGAVAGVVYPIRAWEIGVNVKAMLFYSVTGAASTPFLGGTLCVNPPLARAGLVDTVGNSDPCTGHTEFDFNAYIKSGVDPVLVAGQQVWFQWWYREPAFAPPNNVGLTAGLSAIICQ